MTPAGRSFPECVIQWSFRPAHPAKPRWLFFPVTASSYNQGYSFVRSAFAGFLSGRLYALPALAPLLRAAAPLTLFFALQHAVNGVMSGLGLQKQLLLPSLFSAALSLACMYFWAADPALRILGAVRAMVIAQAAGVLWGLGLVMKQTGGNVREAALAPKVPP